MTITSDVLATRLDQIMAVEQFRDASWNGLQVANSGRIDKICAGVDASLPFFEAAVAQGAGMVICHHGISWGTSLARITGLNYRLVSFLLRHDVALWACHLPLDAHPVHGNNAVLARLLGLRQRRSFADYNGQLIGICGELPQAIAFEVFAEQVRRKVNPQAAVHPFGKEQIKRVGVVSGGAASEVAEAVKEGLDAYITGEPSLEGYNRALQEEINVIYAGHYATEVFGVQALLRVIQKKFALTGTFVPLPAVY